jgi:hypothetical protein
MGYFSSSLLEIDIPYLRRYGISGKSIDRIAKSQKISIFLTCVGL